MATMTFQINDASTSTGNPAVWVTVTENADGTLTFNVWQEGGVIGDLRGLFFDISDESILNSLVITSPDGTMTEYRIGNDTIKDLGDGANMNGLLGSDKGYDIGVEVGTSGIGSNDIQSFSFTLDSTARDLTLADLGGVDFAARLTSVGVVGGTRADSSKILEITSQAIEANNDLAVVDEDSDGSGNVFSNDQAGSGTTTVTGWSGGVVGSQIALSSEGDIIGTLKLNADGSYVLDASAADELSEGEQIVYNFSYDVRNQTEATSWSDDKASFTVVVNGQNDGPDANNDAAGNVEEGSLLSGNVTANDTDVDRLDTHTYSLSSPWDGPGSLTFNADGTWTYDSGDLADLNNGQVRDLSFQYVMTDNHGASDTATVSFSVTGVGGGNDTGGDNTDGDGTGSQDSFPTFEKDISHAVLVFETTSGDRNSDGYYTVKIDGWDGQTDLDASIDTILSWLVANDQNISTDTVFMGAQLKGGSVGGADDSYDDYWAADGDSSYTVEDVLTTKRNDGDATVTAWYSDDTAPVDMSQTFQTQVDQTYLYETVI